MNYLMKFDKPNQSDMYYDENINIDLNNKIRKKPRKISPLYKLPNHHIYNSNSEQDEKCFEVYDPVSCLYEYIYNFLKNMRKRCKIDLIENFQSVAKKFTDLILAQGDIFRSAKASLFAECMLMIVSNYCCISNQ